MARTPITFGADGKPPASLPLAGRGDDTGTPIKIQAVGVDYGGTGVDGDPQRVVSVVDGLPVGHTAVPTSTLTRPSTPTTAYSINDMVASSTTSPTVPSITITRAAAASAVILGGLLRSNGTDASRATAQFQVDLWSAAPGVAVDNAAWAISSGMANHLGTLISGTNIIGTDGLSTPLQVQGQPYIAAALAAGVSVIYWTLKALTAHTPIASQTYTLVLHVAQD
ncbi:hypothetical protein LLG88_13625 [bacterium]|nr:hypothetical protein [bacterium]